MLLGPLLGAAQTPLDECFSYQGLLKLGGEPLNDTADFEFTLWDAAAEGNMIGPVLAADGVSVVEGLFTVDLDFGAGSFNGENRWLEIAVRSPSGEGEFILLTPRQKLTATPYALQTRGLFVDDAGKVGLGTDFPRSLLDVVGEPQSFVGHLALVNDTYPSTTNQSNAYITGYGNEFLENADDARGRLWYLGNAVNTDRDAYSINQLNARLRFGTDGRTGDLVLDVDGKVGVGTGMNYLRSLVNVFGEPQRFVGQFALVNDAYPSTDNSCDVYITGYGNEFLQNTENAQGRLWYLGHAGSGDRDARFINQVDTRLRLGTNARIDDLVIDVDGNVGVGTIAPGAKLTIAGVPGVDGLMFPDGTVQTTAAILPDRHYLNLGPGAFVANDGSRRVVQHYVDGVWMESGGGRTVRPGAFA